MSESYMPPSIEKSDRQDMIDRVSKVYDQVTDKKALEAFKERVEEAARKALHNGGAKPGTVCLVREVDFRVWDSFNVGKEMPKPGISYPSLAACGRAIGLGYNSLSVYRQRSTDPNMITVRGITIEII